MPVDQVFRAVAIDDLAVSVSVWRYTCDTCDRRDMFHDNPMPEGASEFDASRKGWRHYTDADDQQAVKCPSCCAKVDRARTDLETGNG